MIGDEAGDFRQPPEMEYGNRILNCTKNRYFFYKFNELP